MRRLWQGSFLGWLDDPREFRPRQAEQKHAVDVVFYR